MGIRRFTPACDLARDAAKNFMPGTPDDKQDVFINSLTLSADGAAPGHRQ